MKIIAKNKKAYFLYTIIEKFEAGIVLRGTEIKSIRDSKVNFIDSFCEARGGEMFVIGMHISIYVEATYNNHEPTASRKLLLHKKQINRITANIKEKGFSCVPLSIYISDRNKAKLEIALVKGKRLFDKRESIKNRDIKKENSSALKFRNIKL